MTHKPSPITRWFDSSHIPDPTLRDWIKLYEGLAHHIQDGVADGPEKATALRKLLESKDACVRAVIDSKGRPVT